MKDELRADFEDGLTVDSLSEYIDEIESDQYYFANEAEYDVELQAAKELLQELKSEVTHELSNP